MASPNLLSHIVEIQPWFHGELVVLLNDGSQGPTTRAYRAALTGLLPRVRGPQGQAEW